LAIQANDKEDLVSGAVSLGNSGGGGGGLGGGGKSSPSPSPWEFTRSRLRLQTLIGEGNFGQVWKAEAEDICGCQGTLLVAVKTVKDGAAAKEKQELLREMRIMQQVGPHPNVVALLGCCTEQEPFLLIMEYVMYGRLLTFLRDHRTHQTYYNYSTDSEALTSRDLTTFAYCVAKGMEYIYSKGVRSVS
jgi:serine/threonine protein kinase